MFDWTTTVTLALGCVAVLYIGRRVIDRKSSNPLPPGPPGLPWIGNVTGIDTSAPWKTYAEWGRKYGDIVYSRLMGKDIIVINSEKIAKELLENRSRNYSDRPYVVTNDMCGLGFHSALMPYGDRWRLHRRFFHQTFRPDAVTRFLPIQHHKGCQFLRKLLANPGHLDDHVFEYTASVILNSTYNYDPVAGRKDELIEIAMKALNTMVTATRPDIGILVGTFPLLFRLPSWFPGMSLKRQMELAHSFARQYIDRPFQYFLQKEKPSGGIAPSMLRDAMEHMEEKSVSSEEWWMEVLKEASGTAFLAASETSDSVLMTVILMMMLNPAVQAKARAQIDEVVGRDRLPTIDDRPLLPLVDAIFWETIRWSPVTPLAMPHAAVDDDVYDGYHIPKGAFVIPNVWSMAHDETKFPNPHEYIPERFIEKDGSLKPNEVEHIAFGFGRRICVGRHFADTSVWALIAKTLAVFEIKKPLDENGKEITVKPEFTSGLAIHPLPFTCRVVPRPGMSTERLEQLIAATSV